MRLREIVDRLKGNKPSQSPQSQTDSQDINIVYSPTPGTVRPDIWGYKLKNRDSFFKRHKRGLTITVLLLVALLVFGELYVISSTDQNAPQLSLYSNSWADLSKTHELLDDRYDIRAISGSTLVLDDIFRTYMDGSVVPPFDVNHTCLFICGVERRYSDSELDAIGSFIERGGRILLADDFGYAGEEEGIFYNIESGRLLRDTNYVKHPDFVRISVSIPGKAAYTILTDRPAVLRIEPESDFYNPDRLDHNRRISKVSIAQSSSRSWVDLDSDGEFDPEEAPLGTYSVAAYINLDQRNEYTEEYCQGVFTRIQKTTFEGIVISDPSIFINDMINRENNTQFLYDIMNILLPDGGCVVFDLSTHTSTNPVTNTHSTVSRAVENISTDNYLYLLMAPIIMIFIFWITARRNSDLSTKPICTQRYRNFNVINQPSFGKTDYYMMRDAFLFALETHRAPALREHISPVDPYFIDAVPDEELRDFVFSPRGMSPEYFNYIAGKMKDFFTPEELAWEGC